MAERLAEYTAQLATLDRASAYVSWTIANALARQNNGNARQIFERRLPPHSPQLELAEKASVPPMTMTGVESAPLAAVRPWADAFLALLRPRELLGRLVGARKVPFNVRVPKQTAGATAAWIGENALIPASQLAFAHTTVLGVHKVAGIVSTTKDLAQQSDPSSTAVISEDLIAAIVAVMDASLFDQNGAGSDRPAGLLFGLTPVAGTDLENAVGNLWMAVSGGLAAKPYFVANGIVANRLTQARDTTGARFFPEVGKNGGTIDGVPLLVSPHAPPDKLVLADASSLLVADSGVELDEAGSATVFSDSAPTGTGDRVSYFQQDLVGLKGTRFVSWLLGRSDGVGFVDVAA